MFRRAQERSTAAHASSHSPSRGRPRELCATRRGARRGLLVHDPDLPGRGAHQDRPFPTDWPTLIADLADAVDDVDDGAPRFLFGHRFGALLAYEVARRRDARGGPALAGLFLSSYHAPVAAIPVMRQKAAPTPCPMRRSSTSCGAGDSFPTRRSPMRT
ncbi:alpha/beta fold hydrolase [Burkholderia sp. FERM BP-3421]|uniref:alpha/beta fold hydrolase n=1 Tax=Burkholderia sp. FERM BP-3421 TaxID=1494466 RepID=UPI003FCCF45D